MVDYYISYNHAICLNLSFCDRVMEMVHPVN